MMVHYEAKKHVRKAPFTKNHIFIYIHQIMGPGEGLTQTSHVLWHEEVIVSPAVRSQEKRLVTDQYNSSHYY